MEKEIYTFIKTYVNARQILWSSRIYTHTGKVV